MSFDRHIPLGEPAERVGEPPGSRPAGRVCASRGRSDLTTIAGQHEIPLAHCFWAASRATR